MAALLRKDCQISIETLSKQSEKPDSLNTKTNSPKVVPK